MWIFDSCFKGLLGLWSRERGLERINAAYPPSLYMHLKEPHAHWEIFKLWKTGSGSKSAALMASFGNFEGHRIYASRKVAEKEFRIF